MSLGSQDIAQARSERLDREREIAARAETWMARAVKAGWHMAGVGTIESIYTHDTTPEVTFYGPQGVRRFHLDALVEATAPESHVYAFEVWPDPLPQASYPMLLPERVTVKAPDASIALTMATAGIKAGQAIGACSHIRSMCSPAHPGIR